MRDDKQCILFGAGGHGKVILDIILGSYDLQCVLLLDDTPVQDQIPMVQFPPPFLPAIPVFHGIGDLLVRRELQSRRYTTAKWTNIIAKTAHVSMGASIVQGSQILHHVYVGPHSVMGPGCIINNHASVDHDCTIGSFCHIAPGVVLCGNVHVGDNTLIGAGSVVIPDMHIGDNCIIAAGSRVFKDIPDNSIMIPNGDVRIRRSFRKGVPLYSTNAKKVMLALIELDPDNTDKVIISEKDLAAHAGLSCSATVLALEELAAEYCDGEICDLRITRLSNGEQHYQFLNTLTKKDRDSFRAIANLVRASRPEEKS